MNITYLFGAGASFNAIPVVKDLNISMRAEMNAISYHFDQLTKTEFEAISIPTITQSLVDSFIKDYERVITNNEKHQSIDTFAKKLYLKGKLQELKVLKTILSICFILIQNGKTADLRYDNFFASILKDSTNNFPSNLKILSWNYDYQFEKAFAEYSDDYRFDACSETLNIISKNTDKFSNAEDGFGILKLNGTASFMLDKNRQRQYHYLDTIDKMDYSKLVYTCLQNYASLIQHTDTKDKLQPSLSFAWEDDINSKSIVDKAVEFAIQTEVLIVIGYSFPLFNRNVDRTVIRSMKQLKKVYFQAPDAYNLKERFQAIRDDLKDADLITRTDTDQFAFPNEF